LDYQESDALPASSQLCVQLDWNYFVSYISPDDWLAQHRAEGPGVFESATLETPPNSNKAACFRNRY